MSTATSRMRAARDAHQFILRERRRLKVQPAQRAGRPRKRMVVLNESELKSRAVPGRAAVCFREKPARVPMPLRRHDLDRGNRRIFHLHRPSPNDNISAGQRGRTGRASLPEAAERRHPNSEHTTQSVAPSPQSKLGS